MAGWGGHFRSKSQRPGQWAARGQMAQTESSAWDLARALGQSGKQEEGRPREVAMGRGG